MGSSQIKDIHEEKESFPSPSKAITETVSLNSPRKETKDKKQLIKMVDLLELSNQLGQSLDRLDYISKQLEKRGVYIEKGLLGEGGSGKILKAFNDREEKLAIKFVKCEDEHTIKQSLMEYQKLKQFNSDYITKVKDLVQVEKDTETYHIIIMERCECDLKQFISKIKYNHSVLSKKFVLEVFTQLAEGLNVLHSKNIIHLDIKPANILHGYDKKWKFADLGVSKKLSNSKQHTSHLNGFTACYSSPEQFQIMSYNAKKRVTKASDVYSLGIVFLELTGVKINKKWLLKQKMQQSNNFSEYLNPEFEQLNQQVIMPMIAYQPEQRIEPKQLIEILKEISAESNSKEKFEMLFKPQQLKVSNLDTLTDTDLNEIPVQKKLKGREEDNSYLKKKPSNKNYIVNEEIEGWPLQNEKRKVSNLQYFPSKSSQLQQQQPRNYQNQGSSSFHIKNIEKLSSPKNKIKSVSEIEEDCYGQLDYPFMSNREGRQEQSERKFYQEELRKIIKIQEQRQQIKVFSPLLSQSSQELLSSRLYQEPNSGSFNLKESSQYNVGISKSYSQYQKNQNGNQTSQFNQMSRHITNIFNQSPNSMTGQNRNYNMIGYLSSPDLHSPKDANQYSVRSSHRQGTLPANLDQFKNKLGNIEKNQQISSSRLQGIEENQVKFPLISPLSRRSFM